MRHRDQKGVGAKIKTGNRVRPQALQFLLCLLPQTPKKPHSGWCHRLRTDAHAGLVVHFPRFYPVEGTRGQKTVPSLCFEYKRD